MTVGSFDSLDVGYDFEYDQRNHLFYTKCLINGKWCGLKIDSGSWHNFASDDLVSKLGLNVFDHPKPYDLSGLYMGAVLKVSKQVVFGLSMGPYVDEMVFDVIPMMDCHVRLGRPWLFDRDVIHHGRSNEYVFNFGGKTISLKPMTSQQVQEMLENSSLCSTVVFDSDENLEPIWDSGSDLSDEPLMDSESLKSEFDSEVFSDLVVHDLEVGLEDDTRKPVWDDELTCVDEPCVSFDCLNSEIDLAVLVVKDTGARDKGGCLLGNLPNEHFVGSLVSEGIPYVLDFMKTIWKFLIWVISFLKYWVYFLVYSCVREFKDVGHLLEILGFTNSYFHIVWKQIHRVGMGVLGKMDFVKGNALLQVFGHYRYGWNWFIAIRNKSRPSLMGKNRILRVVKQIWNLGMFGVNLRWLENWFELLGYPFRELLFSIRVMNKKEIQLRRDMLWKATNHFLLLFILSSFMLYDLPNLLKMKTVWFGYDIGFGLIDTYSGGSTWSTTFGVSLFRAEYIDLMDTGSEDNAVIKRVGLKLINTNHDSYIGTLFGTLADFKNDVHTLGYLIDPRCLDEGFLNFGACFPFWSGREMWSFPFKGGGDDADLKTTIVGKIFYWNKVFVLVVLARIWMVAWLKSWNGTYLVLVVRHLVSRTSHLFCSLGTWFTKSREHKMARNKAKWVKNEDYVFSRSLLILRRIDLGLRRSVNKFQSFQGFCY